MEEIKVPIVPLSKEDEIVEEIYEASAKEPEDLNVFFLDDGDNFLESIKLILLGIGMEKYIYLFSKSQITIKTFLNMDESDLKELGITDPKDIKIIVKNLRSFHMGNKNARRQKEKYKSEFDNPVHDLQIARNVKNELILLQNYCCYLELQMRRQKLTDYRINWKESASTYLKAFTETALLQARILCHEVFHDEGDTHLIGRISKLSNVTLPKNLKEKLQKKKPKEKLKIFSIIVFGILSLTVLIKSVLPKI